MRQRAKFLGTLVSMLGCPYRYGGKGESVAPGELLGVAWPFPVLTPEPRLFDCSGLITHGWFIASGQDWRAFHDCDRLLRRCRKVERPRNGTLVFYGRTLIEGRIDAQHVVAYLDRAVIGANGGDSSTTSLSKAVEQSARVCLRPGPMYRQDVLGYYELPWADEP